MVPIEIADIIDYQLLKTIFRHPVWFFWILLNNM